MQVVYPLVMLSSATRFKLEGWDRTDARGALLDSVVEPSQGSVEQKTDRWSTSPVGDVCGGRYSPAPPRHGGDGDTFWLDAAHCSGVLACNGTETSEGEHLIGTSVSWAALLLAKDNTSEIVHQTQPTASFSTKQLVQHDIFNTFCGKQHTSTSFP